MLKFWIVAGLLFIGSIFIVSLVVNLLKLSFAVFKLIFVAFLVVGLFFVLAYYTGLLEKIPYLNDLFLKFKDVILPGIDKAKDAIKTTT